MRHILIKMSAPVVTDEEFLQKLFPDTNLKMIDDITYRRKLTDGTIVKETVFGNPTLK